MTEYGRRCGDALGSAIINAIMAEVKRRRPPTWETFDFTLSFRATTDRDGFFVIENPRLSRPVDRRRAAR